MEGLAHNRVPWTLGAVRMDELAWVAEQEGAQRPPSLAFILGYTSGRRRVFLGFHRELQSGSGAVCSEDKDEHVGLAAETLCESESSGCKNVSKYYLGAF